MSLGFRLAGFMIASQIAAMAGFSAFAVVLPEMTGLWSLSPGEAGWIGGAYFLGYAAAVPLLVGVTDRADPRLVYLVGCALALAGGLGFAWWADGVASACLARAVAGAGLAGTYMPGLRILTDRLAGAARLRAVPYYTASFGIGVSVSYVLAGAAQEVGGWPAVFLVSALGSVAAAALLIPAVAGVRAVPAPPPAGPARHPLDFRPVFANARAMAFVLGYTGHCWELFALRAWTVAFLVFAWGQDMAGEPGQAAARWSAAVVLTGVVSSILGAEAALRWGRVRTVRLVALTSVAAGLATGVAGGFGFAAAIAAVAVYTFLIAADSGALTAGAVAAARPGEQGATLAVHTLMGFGGSALGPVAVGLALAAAGGLGSPSAWALAFAVMAAGSAVAAAAVSLARDPPAH